MARPWTLFVVASLLAVCAATASAQNVVENPGFTAVLQLTEWENPGGQIWSAMDSDSVAGSGSVQIEVSDLDSEAITQCVQVLGGHEYEFGADVFLTVEGQTQGRGGVVVRTYTDDDCVNEQQNSFPQSMFITEAQQGQWTNVASVFTAPGGATAARVEARATKMSGSQGQPLVVNIDDVFLQDTGAVTTTTLRGPECADPVVPFGTYTASDALFVLRAAVDTHDCDACLCDVVWLNGVLNIVALSKLRLAVGDGFVTNCPPCV